MNKTSDLVFNHIESRIIHGEWKPGDKITPEIELSKELQVSRSSVREAIQQLVTLKILHKKVGVSGGTFVNKPSPSDYLENLLPLIILGESNYTEIMKIRLQLEQLSVIEFIKNHSPEDLKNLQDTHMAMINSTKDSSEFLRQDILFHRIIARGSKNPVLDKILEMLFNLNEHYAKNIYEALPLEKNIRDHSNILEAIQSKEEEISIIRIRDHLLRKIEKDDIGSLSH